MNVTVVIARPMQSATEGRPTIELSVPPRTDLADVLQTLLLLYPGLKAWQPSEHPVRRPHFSVAMSGTTVVLFAVGSLRV